MNTEQRNNLAVLRDFLLTKNVRFDMCCYRTKIGYNPDGKIELSMPELEGDPQNCGTAGCALGWAPFVIPLLPSEYSLNNFDQLYSVEYVDYSERVFGVHGGTTAWDWMFSGFWQHLDNTRQGAAFRIQQILDGMGQKHIEMFLADDYNEYYPNDDEVRKYFAERDAWLLTKGITL